MTETDHKAGEFPSDYYGIILSGDGSAPLKERLADWIRRYQAFDALGGPVIPYISAWRDDDQAIWYEFVGKGFLDLLGCSARDAARVWRSRILEHRTYTQPESGWEVEKHVLDSRALQASRPDIRQESRQTGSIEAVYKLRSSSGQLVWVKDLAGIDVFPTDQLNIARGFLTPVTKEMEMEETCDRLISQLRMAISQIKTLRGLLPICASCKKIRDDRGYWNQIENYLLKHTDAAFSHGICPDCVKKLYPEYYKKYREPLADLTIQLDDPHPDLDDWLRKL